MICSPNIQNEAVWAQAIQEKTKLYRGVRPDSFTDWTTRDWTKDVGKDLAIKYIGIEYENAVDEQKKELRDYKKRTKTQTQLPPVEPVPMTTEEIEEDLSRVSDG